MSLRWRGRATVIVLAGGVVLAAPLGDVLQPTEGRELAVHHCPHEPSSARGPGRAVVRLPSSLLQFTSDVIRLTQPRGPWQESSLDEVNCSVVVPLEDDLASASS